MQNITNIRMLPDDNTIKNITDLADSFNLPHKDFDEHPHCTIIYSPDVIDAKNITLPKVKLPIIANNARLGIFETKDDGNVLVIELDCEAAEQCFNYMKTKYNIMTKYDEYRAHITLQKNIGNKQWVLPEIAFDLCFDKLLVTNCD